MDLDQLAADFSVAHPTHTEWPAMRDYGLLRLLQAQFADVRSLDLLWPLEPRPVDPTHELVVFTDRPPGTPMPPPGVEFFALPFLMELSDAGWLVAGFWDEAPIPGWPPRLPSARDQATGPLRLS